MARPTTVRLPDDLLREIDRRATAQRKDRASLLRELLRKGLAVDLEQEVLGLYASGLISLSEAGRRLRIDPFEFLNRLRQQNVRLNVSLEDWIDSRSSL